MSSIGSGQLVLRQSPDGQSSSRNSMNCHSLLWLDIQPDQTLQRGNGMHVNDMSCTRSDSGRDSQPSFNTFVSDNTESNHMTLQPRVDNAGHRRDAGSSVAGIIPGDNFSVEQSPLPLFPAVLPPNRATGNPTFPIVFR